jgi:hypothetical protein
MADPVTSSAGPPRPASDRLVLGELLKYGPAPYEFDPMGSPSYFVTLRTARGEVTLWGRGLARAIEKSRTQPQVGDAIGVRENSIEPGTFVRRERDETLQARTTLVREAPRPRWMVERREFFDERRFAAKLLRDANASRHTAVADHPELEPAYWALDSAEKVARERIGDAASRARFVGLVRETLARTLERGEDLPTPLPTSRATGRASPQKSDPATR